MPRSVGKQKMNPFESFWLTWWQAGLLKLSMVALGLAVGSTWPEVFAGLQTLLWVLFVVPGFYLSYVWLKQI
jgi:hypothetical protein